ALLASQRRTSRQLASEEIRRRNRAFSLVRPQTHPLTRSLPELRQDVLDIVRAGIAACAADALVERALSGGGAGDPKGPPSDISDGGPEGPPHAEWDVGRPFRGAKFVVLAAGKAAPAMARAAARALGPRIRAGLVVGVTHADIPEGFESIVGGHPLPTPDSEAAGRKALALAASVGADETLLVLISGGASALMAVPADGITLDDKRATTQLLLRAGADIHALN